MSRYWKENITSVAYRSFASAILIGGAMWAVASYDAERLEVYHWVFIVGFVGFISTIIWSCDP